MKLNLLLFLTFAFAKPSSSVRSVGHHVTQHSTSMPSYHNAAPQHIKKTVTTTVSTTHHPASRAHISAPHQTYPIPHAIPHRDNINILHPNQVSPPVTIINNHASPGGHSFALPLLMGGSGYHTIVHHHDYGQEISLSAVVIIAMLILLLIVCICKACQNDQNVRG